MTPSAVSIAASTSLAAPVARQRRVEHVAEPVQDHRLLGLAQDAVVDALVVGRARARRGPARGSPSRSACRRASRSPPSALRRRGSRRRRVFAVVEVPGGRCRSPRRRARRARRAPRRASGGSARARSASRGPCRAARCPSPRRRRGPATTGAGGRRWSRPSRPRHCSHGSTAASGSATTCAAE